MLEVILNRYTLLYGRKWTQLSLFNHIIEFVLLHTLCTYQLDHQIWYHQSSLHQLMRAEEEDLFLQSLMEVKVGEM